MELGKFTLKQKKNILRKISSKEKELLEVKKFKERTKIKLKAPQLKLK